MQPLPEIGQALSNLVKRHELESKSRNFCEIDPVRTNGRVWVGGVLDMDDGIHLVFVPAEIEPLFPEFHTRLLTAQRYRSVGARSSRDRLERFVRCVCSASDSSLIRFISSSVCELIRSFVKAASAA